MLVKQITFEFFHSRDIPSFGKDVILTANFEGGVLVLIWKEAFTITVSKNPLNDTVM